MTKFGGPWTEEKLDILESYLKEYLRVLKRYRGYFTLVYIDAFAGEGAIQIRDAEGVEFIQGSPKRALNAVADGGKPFDRFIFIESNSRRMAKLKRIELEDDFSNRNIDYMQKDANEALKSICVSRRWRRTRAVLFIDPFSTELEWATLEAIAKTDAIDTWLLFPISAISRMLPRDKEPPASWKIRLNRIFGDDSWKSLYRSHLPLLPDVEVKERDKGGEQITNIYKNRLNSVFGNRLLKESKKLVIPEKNVTLFEFMFLAGNPRGRAPAHNIAKHLIERI